MAASTIDVGTEEGRSQCLNLDDTSVNISPVLACDTSTLTFQRISYGYFKAGPEHFTQRDKPHGLYQVFHTHKGCGRCIIDGREYILKPGTIALMDFGVCHRYETAGDVWEYEWVNFSSKWVTHFYQIINPDGFIVYDLDNSTELTSVLGEIGACIGVLTLKSYVHCSALVFRLLDAFAQYASSRQVQHLPHNHSRISDVIKYIDDHYAEKLTLESLAEIAYLSKYYFLRTFVAQVGLSPYQYINSVRLTRAKALLDNTTMSVEEIGWAVGYGGAKNFIRSFKNATGQTPKQYRNPK